MYAVVYLEPSRASLRKSQKSFIVDVGLGSKYASGIGFTPGKIFRMSKFVSFNQCGLQKFVIAFLFLELIKNMLVLMKKV